MRKKIWRRFAAFYAAVMLGVTAFPCRLYAEGETDTEEVTETEESGAFSDELSEGDTDTEVVSEEEPASEPDEDPAEEQEEVPAETAEAETEEHLETDAADTKAVRTIMMYLCGSDLESMEGYATENIRQILDANFSSDESIRFIIMTGGADEWYTPSEWLYDPSTGESPGEISNVYNQIWEAKGQDAPENAGKLVLLDPDGVSGDGADALPNKKELMTKSQTLQKFIDYCAENFPAEKFDLILWDHGGGTVDSFGKDDNSFLSVMKIHQLREAFGNNAVTRNGGKFDIINFDACLMSSIELLLSYSEYMNCYIASPELIPGNGQYYTDWLNTLGEDPDCDAYTLGRQIVDDYCDYYNGGQDDASLAVYDVEALFANGFLTKLQEWNDVLTDELLGNDQEKCLYYDELASSMQALQYGRSPYCDFGNFVSLAGIAVRELDEDNISGGVIDETNRYTETAKSLLGIMNNPDIMYTRSTDTFRKEGQYSLRPDGTIEYDYMRPSGIYSFFPNKRYEYIFKDYIWQTKDLLDAMPEDDPRTVFLRDYRNSVLYSYLIYEAGYAVSVLADRGEDRESINYDKVMEYWLDDPIDPEDHIFSPYHIRIEDYINALEEQGIDPAEWLERMVSQMASEVVYKDNISVARITGAAGDSYRFTISDTSKKVIDNLRVNINAELPAAQKYLDDNPDVREMLDIYELSSDFTIGHISGSSDYDDPEENIEAYIRWLNDPSGVWHFEAVEDCWYAVSDAEGKLHVMDVGTYPNGDFITDCSFPLTTEEGEEEVRAAMIFTEDGELKELYLSEETGFRKVKPQDLMEPVELMPVMTLSGPFSKYYIPISESPITVSAENADLIRLEYTNVDNIPEIADTDGDGKKLRKVYVLRDIYNYEYDLSDLTEDPDETLVDIELAEIQDAVYSGAAQTPVVLFDGEVLKEGDDYIFYTLSGDEECTDAKEYEVLLTGTGSYAGESIKTFRILPASLEEAEVTGIKDMPYTGEPVVQSPVVKVGGMTLEEGKDYTAAYENNTETGTAAMTISGTGNYSGEIELTFEILPGAPESLIITPEGPLEIPTLQTLQLSVSVQPEGSDDRVVWTSSDEKTASADENGRITAKTYGRVTITASSATDPNVKAEVTVQTRFHDVTDSSQSYYKPVYWGADSGVVAGFDKGVYFGPDEECTRAQFVTFLWRLAGRPVGTKEVSFPDVDPNANYYRAVKWAVSEGIIVGFKHENGPATFEPDGIVTRGQTATMLWRYGGRKTASQGATFSDVKKEDNIYRAVSWGQEAGFIKGYKTGEYAGQFRPEDSCLRQHIVTFLYRYDRDVKQ